MINEYQLAGGSIIGTSHRLSNKNNQDSFYYKVNKNFILALVCDGCGSCDYSEAGSQIGIRLIAHLISSQISRLVDIKSSYQAASERFWKRIKDDSLAYIRMLANQMSDSVSEIISNYFLFTIVGTIITQSEVIFFSLGDGIVIINGELIKLGPFEDNTPPYLTYGLVETSLKSIQPDLLNFKIVERLQPYQVDTFLIGTDGVLDLINSADKTIPGKANLIGSIDQFWNEEIFFRNPDAINRKLNLINRDCSQIDWDKKINTKDNGRLPDDTTLIVGKTLGREV